MPTTEELVAALSDRVRNVRGHCARTVMTVGRLDAAEPNPFLAFCGAKWMGQVDGPISTAAAVVLVSAGHEERLESTDDQLVLGVDDPRLEFVRLATDLFSLPPARPVVDDRSGVHRAAHVASSAVIGPGVTIGEGSVVLENVVIRCPTTIGRDTIVNANVTIGSDGFGFERDPDSGRTLRFPHIGGVVIGDRVEIGANTCIDRGALGDTVVEDDAKIDNLVHVAHNVRIRDRAFVIANAMLGGSVDVGARSWIAPSAAVTNGVTVGADSLVGLGAVVTRSVPVDAVVTGSPARPIDEFRAVQRKLSESIADGDDR